MPRKVAKESSGAEVVSIQAARERAAARPHRGGTPLGTAAAKPATHEAGESPRVPGAGIAELGGAARASDPAGHETGALAGGAAMPMAAPEPEPVDDLIVSEPSQVVRMRTYAIPTDLEAARTAARPHQDLDRSESGVHGRIDELAVAAGVVQPSAHKTNRLLLVAAVGGALATLSLAGVVIYLVGRGPQVQVREIVRLKSPEELGADSDVAVARLLAEKQFAAANPSAGSSGTGPGAAAPGKEPTRKVAGRPTAGGGPAPGKKGEPKAAGGTGMAGFFKSQPGTGAASGVAAPNLASPPEVRQPAGRKVSDDEIVKAINRQRGTLSVCYNRALKHDDSLKSVRLDVTVKFGFSGRPTSVVINDSKHRTTFLGQCLADTIRRWSFPSGGDDRTTVMPLVLQGE
ncbi:MAG: AgmX/PglI C-terminal domain-containing protein [Deltaproteobacteria bacterium]|nr:AgmX/PglI C-terminal domain-containing protein [Deltaproteobacteria bacterium]